MKIKTFLLLFLMPPICIMLALLTWMNYQSASERATFLAQVEVDLLASTHSARVFDKILHAEAAATSLASALVELHKMKNPSREAHSRIVKGVAESSEDYFGVWALWEPDAFDGRDSEFVGNSEFGNSSGSANAYWLREKGDIIYNLSDHYNSQHYYVLPMQAGRMTAIPPYYDDETSGNVLMTSIAMPIMDNGQPLGVVGIDIELDFIQGLIQGVRPYDTGYITLVTDKGVILAQPGGKRTSVSTLPLVDRSVLTQIRENKAFTIEEASVFDSSPIQSFYIPIMLQSFEAPWYFAVSLPMDRVMEKSHRELMVQLTISGIVLLLLGGLVFYTAEKVSRPMRRIARYSQEVAGGAYTAAIGTTEFVFELNELQSALQSMLESLLRIMNEAEQRKQRAEYEAERARTATEDAKKARETAENATRKGMQEAAFKLEGIVQETRAMVLQVDESMRLATDGTETQKSYATATARAMTQMTTATGNVAKNASDAFQSAEQAREHAINGAEIVGQTIESINDVNARARDIAHAMEQMESQAGSITSVMNVITDIADQTNLLALNAAIEAARAGDAGRGFAVVADEVRKLAEKTMLATREVGQVTHSIRQSTGENIRIVEEAVRAVQKSTEKAHSAGESLESIVHISDVTANKIHAIVTASEEQSVTSEHILQSTEGVRVVAEENSALMVQANAKTRAIDELTRRINDVVTELKNM